MIPPVGALVIRRPVLDFEEIPARSGRRDRQLGRTRDTIDVRTTETAARTLDGIAGLYAFYKLGDRGSGLAATPMVQRGPLEAGLRGASSPICCARTSPHSRRRASSIGFARSTLRWLGRLIHLGWLGRLLPRWLLRSSFRVGRSDCQGQNRRRDIRGFLDEFTPRGRMVRHYKTLLSVRPTDEAPLVV
jgi:hypothetical protein